MNFIETIVEKENKFLLELKKIKSNGFPTYLLGAGEGADNVEKRYEDFIFAGRLVNRRYYQEDMGTLCLEDFLDSVTHKVNLVVASKGKYYVEKWDDKIAIFANYDIFSGNYYIDQKIMMILSIMVYTFNSYKEDSYAAIGRAA